MSEYLWNFWIAVSQLLNTIIGGSPADDSVEHARGVIPWKATSFQSTL